nr:hypothetical protein [uncultured Sulfurimonas sp.]
MKLVFLMLTLTVMLFSNEKQIIVGSFVQDNYASNALVRLNNRILNDEKLSKLIDKNSIQTELKKMGEYNAVSLFPFTSYVQLLRTLRALEKYYDDAYVLDNGQKIEIAEVIVRKEIEEIEEEKPKAIEEAIKEIIEDVKVKESEVHEEVKVEKPKVQESESQEIKEEVTIENIVLEQDKDYILEILLALLLLIAGGYILYKKSAQKTEE